MMLRAKVKSIDDLYRQLRELVADNFTITICDKTQRETSKIIIKPISRSHPWTCFEGKTIEEAFQRTINKLQNPQQDYIELDGYVWKASKSSIYEETYIQHFLREKEASE